MIYWRVKIDILNKNAYTTLNINNTEYSLLYNKILFILLLSLSINLYASDLAREKRWADQVVDAIMDGDAVWLNNGKNDFLSIYLEAEENKGKSVIVMHGTGVHPNWPQVVQPLRIALAEQNWNTLSIQMPILANDADHLDYAPLYDEVAPRIDAAIKYLKKIGSNDIVLLAHSQGSTMAAYYLTSSKQDIKGFVAIGLSAFGKDPRMNGVKSLEKIYIPVLDLYAKEDLQSILASTQLRVLAAKKAANQNFNQTQIEGNHFYDGFEDSLVKAVADWIKQIK
jgi:predicted esterase